MVAVLVTRAEVPADVDHGTAGRRDVGHGALDGQEDGLVEPEDDRVPTLRQRTDRQVEMGHAHGNGGDGRRIDACRRRAGEQPGRAGADRSRR